MATITIAGATSVTLMRLAGRLGDCCRVDEEVGLRAVLFGSRSPLVGFGGAGVAGVRRARRLGLLLGVLAGLVVSAACLASAARAADRVYWDNGTTISFANLDGSGGGADLNLTGATTVNDPFGVAVDSAAGRIYWVTDGNFGAGKVSFANLDGSGGGGDLNTTGATANEPGGVAVDPVARRVYWANTNAINGILGTISWANLDGSGGGDLNTTGATAGCGPNPPPSPPGPCKALGLAVDPAAGKVYWSDFGAVNKISFANLNGSGGGDLNTTGATVSDPAGVAVDAAAGRIYWANAAANKISFARLDGSGGGDLSTAGASVKGPVGVAVDAAAGRIYWANGGGNGAGSPTSAQKISWAKLDGSGGGDLKTTGATVQNASFPVLVESPRGAGAPAVTGGSVPGAVLSCGSASWAGDLPGAFLYRAPQSLAHQWSLGGTDIVGATGSSLTASVAGDYRCRVTASNTAGTAAQTSAAHTVSASPPKRKPTRAIISALSLSNTTFTVGRVSTPLNGRTALVRHQQGTVFSFRLDQAATVRIAIQATLTGRRVGGRCVPDSRALRRSPRCARAVTLATLTRSAHLALNKVVFSGRIGGRALKPGGYLAVFTASDAAGSSPPKTLSFTIALR